LLAAPLAVADDPPVEPFGPYFEFPRSEFSHLDPWSQTDGIHDDWLWQVNYVLDDEGTGYDVTFSMHRRPGDPPYGPPEWHQTHMCVHVMPHAGPHAGEVWNGCAIVLPPDHVDYCESNDLFFDECLLSPPGENCGYVHHRALQVPRSDRCPDNPDVPVERLAFQRLEDGGGLHRYRMRADVDVVSASSSEVLHVDFEIEALLDGDTGDTPLLQAGDGRYFYGYQSLYPGKYEEKFGVAETMSYFYEQFGKPVGGYIGLGPADVPVLPRGIAGGFIYSEHQPKNGWECWWWGQCFHAGWEQHRIALHDPADFTALPIHMDINFDFVRVPENCEDGARHLFTQTHVTMTMQLGETSYEIPLAQKPGEPGIYVSYSHFDGYYTRIRWLEDPPQFIELRIPKNFALWSLGGDVIDPTGTADSRVRVPAFFIVLRRVLQPEAYAQTAMPTAVVSRAGAVVERGSWRPYAGFAATEQTKFWTVDGQADPYAPLSPAAATAPSRTPPATGAGAALDALYRRVSRDLGLDRASFQAATAAAGF
jgi:hypothetical protein